MLKIIPACLLLAGCMTAEEWAASGMTPEEAMACAAKTLEVPPREDIPTVVYNDGALGQSGYKTAGQSPSLIVGRYDRATNTITMAYRGDDETLVHEMAHALGEMDERRAKWAGKMSKYC